MEEYDDLEFIQLVVDILTDKGYDINDIDDDSVLRYKWQGLTPEEASQSFEDQLPF